MYTEGGEFRAETLCRVAGCDAAVFRGWRNRNGLLPYLKLPPNWVGKKYSWNSYSLLDICIARVVVVLTQHGARTQEAVDFANRFGRLYVGQILGRDIKNAIVAFGGDLTGERVAEKQTIQKLIEKGKGGPITVLDLKSLTDEVVAQIDKVTDGAA